MSVYQVRVVPVRVRWHRYWELHIQGGGVTQSRRNRRDAERTVRDYVHLMSGVAREEVGVVLVAAPSEPQK